MFKLVCLRGGHNNICGGAVAYLNEVEENRLVLEAVKKYLDKEGQNYYDCTPPDVRDKNSDLRIAVERANNLKADLFVSIHFNKAYKHYDGALGTECCVYSFNSPSVIIANRIIDNISNLGFKKRELLFKPQFYELRETKCPSIIIEVCFVEAVEDVKLYKKIGYDKIGKVIAEAILNKEINEEEIRVGDRVYIKKEAKTYYKLDKFIPQWVKSKLYTISKIEEDKVLLKEINSWVFLKDVYRIY